jgi:hypothetical protein
MAFALRFSGLPLLDSIMRLAFDTGVGNDLWTQTGLALEKACEIERSAFNLERFSLTKYFNTELKLDRKLNLHIRKNPDSLTLKQN